MPGANRLVLDAAIAARDELRYTPAGIAVLDFTLSHQSSQREAGTERQVGFELQAIAFAEKAQALFRLSPGAQVRCQGFLARRYRTGTSVAFHVQDFEILKGREHAPSRG